MSGSSDVGTDVPSSTFSMDMTGDMVEIMFSLTTLLVRSFSSLKASNVFSLVGLLGLAVHAYT